MAPGANIIAVKYKSDETGSSTFICDAASYIFDKADQLNRPAVINMSIGSTIGAHDGTSLFEECLDALVAEKEGRSIVVSAGNSGASPYGYNHAGFAINNDSLYGFDVKLYSPSDVGVIDIWMPTSCFVDISVGIYENSVFQGATSFVTNGSAISASSSIANIMIDRSETENALNGKSHTLIALSPGGSFNPSSHLFDVVFDGECSDFHAWTYPYSSTLIGTETYMFGGTNYKSGDNDSTIMIPATANNVVSVGAHISRATWTDILGVVRSDPMSLITDVGELAYFSSRGPAVNASQGIKPTITAPGAYIVSTREYMEDYTKQVDSGHAVMEGTSMAAPHVSGIVALMFQVHPDLTYDQISNYLMATARNDGIDQSLSTQSSVGTAPNDDWGYGKIDAYSAVNAVLTDYPLPESGDDNNSEPSGSANDAPSDDSADGSASSDSGGGGCKLMAGSNNHSTFALFILLMSIAFMPIVIRRKIG